ncbi:hypothetical protein SAMN05444673_2732 [Bacillus sp. OV166]|nr:hypothetical protein SAMN05444673_2732 [Bacillus sp. OV166]
MNFFKKLTGKPTSKSSSCCNVEIKEVTETQAGTSNTNESCCTDAADEKSSSC